MDPPESSVSLQGCTRVVLRKTSLVDYPGLLSAVLFFLGCNLRCPWCHNRELVLAGDTQTEGNALYMREGGQKAELCAPFIPLDEALAHIEKRSGILGGVVLSGGEPALFPGLGELTRRIKGTGLKVKLDTNGTVPAALKKLLSAGETSPDYLAMDLKFAPERYAELAPGRTAHREEYAAALRESAALIRASGIPHEFRSLSLPAPYFGESDRAALAPLAGESPWHIRPFVPGNCLDPAWNLF